MALVEQNQQNQVNMSNSLDQVRQFQAELDKAAASIGEAELEAEEELLGVRLKNLSKAQQTKLIQLEQLIDLEEKGIKELAKLKLTLSNRQFAVRKKEIQKEFQLYRAAAEELFKAENKHKSQSTKNSSKTSSINNLKASAQTKSADANIQAADKKVQKALYGVGQVRQELTNAISALQEVTTRATSTANEVPAVQKLRANSAGTPASSTVPPEGIVTPSTVEAPTPAPREFTDRNPGDKVDLGADFDIVFNKFDALLKSDNQLTKSAVDALNRVTADGGKNTSQTSLDLADDLLDSFEATEKQVRKLRELNENKLHNIRLIKLTEEQKLQKNHAQAAYNNTISKITAYEKKQDLIANEDIYRKEAVSKLSIEHLNRANTARLEQLAAESKATDLEHNRKLYFEEELWSQEKAYAEKQNQLVANGIKTEADLAYANSHNKELLDQDLFKLQSAHTELEYKARLDLITAEARAKDLAVNRDKFLREEQHKRELAYKNDQNKLAEEGYKLQADITYNNTHKKELLDQEESKLRKSHAADYQKYQLESIKTLAKASDLEHNRRKYFSKELHNLELNHKNEQNKLAQETINAEAKAKDLEHNTSLYLAEEDAKLRKVFAEEENKLTEELLRTQAGTDFALAHEKEIQEQASHKLRNEHAKALHKTLLDNATAQAKADDIINNKNLYSAESFDKLTIAHAEKQNQLKLAAIDNEAKAAELITNKQKYEVEARLARENTYAETKNKLTEELISAEENLKYDSAQKQELLDQEVFKLQVGHANNLHKANLDLIEARAKAQDLELNTATYRAEAKNALELAHIQTQNSLTDGIIKAEEKRNDLLHNKKLYYQEEEAALNKSIIDEQNRLTENLYKTQKSIAFTKANADKILAIEHQKLQNEHTAAYDKYQKDILAEQAKAEDLEHNRRKYYNKELRDLELSYIKEQNKITEEGIKAGAELDYVTKNKAKLQAQELAKLQNEHIQTEITLRKENIKALAKSTDLEKNRAKYLEEATQKLVNEHTDKQNDLKQGAIDNEAKAADLQKNRDQYILEARLAHENAFYAEKNKLEEESIQIAEGIAWDRAHIDEIMAQELQKKHMGYATEYGEYQKQAGKYAVDQAEFEKNRANKDLANAKADATSGITDAIKSGQFSKIWSADNKEAYSKYMGLRTTELEESYMAKFDAKNPDATEEEREAAKEKAKASAELSANFELVAEAAKNLAQSLNSQTDKIGEKQAPIDTRLQGSQANDKILGSYWKQLARDMNKIGAVNPYFTQEDFASNIETLVNRGVSFDIKQRAFLMTIQEKIANTFDVADGTLLRLIRIQQQDTTAGRLGMESALNSFLNSMYETSEYLTDVAASVRGSLEEMQALMEGAAGTELEFQVQKWMGSLYSVGMSQEAVQGIAQAFGQIASGDISGLSGNGAGNLVIMAANEAGKSIADILQSGLDAKETNELMQAMVNYLAEIADSSSDSRVVQQQLASVYGMRASDLRAATNLASSVKEVSKKDLTYDGMLSQLNKMASSMILRTSTGEMLSNIWGNVQYTMATQMANDPILYLLPRVATLLEDYAGGIDLPFLNVMGFGVDLNTSVSQLMNVAAMSGSILGSLGPMISGLASAVSGDVMLSLAGINTKDSKVPVIARGSAPVLQNLSGSSLSESGYIGNASGSDIKNATLQDAEDSKKQQMIEAKDEETADDVVIKSQQAIIDIYNLLEEVAHGSQSLRVRVVNNHGGVVSFGSGNGENQSTPTTVPSLNNSDNGNWVLSF